MKKKFDIFLWWTFWIYYLEIIYRVFILKNIFSINTLFVFIFCMPFILFLSIITSSFNEKINKLINMLLTFFFIILYLAQIVYYNFYYSMFSFFSLVSGGTGQVFEFWTMILQVILRIWYIFVIVLILFIIFVKFKNKFNYNKKNNNYLLYSCVFLIDLFFIVLSINLDNSRYSLNKLIYKNHVPMLTINKIGLMPTEFLDITRYFNKFMNNNSYKTKEKNIIDEKDYNVLNIDFPNDDLGNYLKNIEPTNKNKYTGLFKNKNIIFINAESFDEIVINKTLTPTLYKMTNNSFVFKNYYQPLYPISTFDGEYMNLTGLLPKEGTWSFREASNNYMPYVFGNSFKNNGYNTYSFHNYVYNFYEREKVHPKMGMEYMACGNGLENVMNCNNWPNSDYEMIKNTIDLYVKNKPFAVYYMTVSGHLNYNFKENDMAIKNQNKVKNLKYSNRVKAYLSASLELEYSLEYLLNKLEKEGILDDTVIVLTPDHFPYGLTCNELNEISTNNRCDKFELYHTSLIIYNSKIKKEEVNNYMSGIDLPSTLYNLFGFKYDSRLLVGRDVFSNNNGLIVLSDRSWINSKGKYNSLNNTFIPFKDKLDKKEIDSFNDEVEERFNISIDILNSDYYNRVLSDENKNK